MCDLIANDSFPDEYDYESPQYAYKFLRNITNPPIMIINPIPNTY